MTKRSEFNGRNIKKITKDLKNKLPYLLGLPTLPEIFENMTTVSLQKDWTIMQRRKQRENDIIGLLEEIIEYRKFEGLKTVRLEEYVKTKKEHVENYSKKIFKKYQEKKKMLSKIAKQKRAQEEDWKAIEAERAKQKEKHIRQTKGHIPR